MGSERSMFSWSRYNLDLSGQLHAKAAVPQENELTLSIEYEVGCVPESVWTKRRKILGPTESRSQKPLSSSPFTTQFALSQLL
jgi:hypothetical protein